MARRRSPPPFAGLLLAGILLGWSLAATAGAEPCRIAFDMGSSGIRAGQAGRAEVARADIDYLTPLTAGRGLAETLPATEAALRELPEKAHFSTNCLRLGGGFSAWRLAAAGDPARLADQLAAIRRQTGVAVLVVPQGREGAYGFLGARQALGDRLRTPYVLDIGGGSLQIAGERRSFGALFGQKLWHRDLCRALGRPGELPCTLQPLSPAELDTARRLLRQRLAGAAVALPGGAAMTAISRPITRGVAPAVARFFNRPGQPESISPAMLRATIDRSAGLSLAETAERLGVDARHAPYLISDLLLVEGLLQATGNHDLRIAEADFTNLPGLLADDRGYRWAARHDCYLQTLRRRGIAAYYADPAACPAEAPTAAAGR